MKNLLFYNKRSELIYTGIEKEWDNINFNECDLIFTHNKLVYSQDAFSLLCLFEYNIVENKIVINDSTDQLKFKLRKLKKITKLGIININTLWLQN